MACGITTDRQAYCWGAGEYGQLGNGKTSRSSPTPATVYGSQPFSSISAGSEHVCALAPNGDAYCWGRDLEGQLGDARTVNSTTPIPVIGAQSFASISAGDRHTCGLTPGGVAYCWGSNSRGQLGAATSEVCGPANVPCSSRPIAVGGGITFRAIAAGGEYSCGIATSGAAYCWGRSDSGQVGSGAVRDSVQVPTQVAGGASFTAISAGTNHTCALASGGAVHCWGSNADLQLGRGPATGGGGIGATPVAIAGVQFASISAGRRHTCGMGSNGVAYCWGSNVFGALGNELQAAYRGLPQPVAKPR